MTTNTDRIVCQIAPCPCPCHTDSQFRHVGGCGCDLYGKIVIDPREGTQPELFATAQEGPQS